MKRSSEMADFALCAGKVTRIPADAYSDARGVLTAIDFGRIGFSPVRAFVIAAPAGAVRGGHGHVTGRQLLMRVSGEIEVELRHRDARASVRLDAETRAILIEAPVWARQTYRGDSPALVVFCDTPFEADGYLPAGDRTRESGP